MSLSMTLLVIAVVTAIILTLLGASLRRFLRASTSNHSAVRVDLRTVRVDNAIVAYEQKIRELATVHYRDSRGNMTFEAKWVGDGRKNKSPLTPCTTCRQWSTCADIVHIAP